MGKSLAQYAAEHPQEMTEQEREQQQEAAAEQLSREERQERIGQLKASILAQLEQGKDPRFIIYSAVEAIGLLTNDAQWAEAVQQCLNSLYAGLEQQSLLIDTAAIEAQRMEQMQSAYNERLRRQLQRQLAGYHKIANSLNEALTALDKLEQ